MAEESQSGKMKLTPEQLKQMQEVMMNQKAKQKPLGKKQLILKKSIGYVVHKMQKIQHHLDRFINFLTKKNDENRNDVVASARSPILFGTYVIGIFVIFGGIWMSLAPLNSATVALGTVISSSNKKIIQNAETGIIKKILVKTGDKVKENQSLIELDDVRAKSDYENILNQFRLSLAAECRLIAERDGLDEIKFPPFLTDCIDDPEVKSILQVQENLFKYKKQLVDSNKTSIKHKIQQNNKTIDGLKSKLQAVKKNLEITTDRMNAMKGLADRQIVSKSSVLEQESKEATLKSEVVGVESDIIGREQEIARNEIEYLNVDNEYLTKTLSELKEVQGQRLQAQEKYPAVTSALEHIIIKSPVDGVVNVVNQHTIGGVVGPGTVLLEISPTNDSLIIEAKVGQKFIDSLKVGLVAKIRFSAFKSRTTPLFTGKVVSISPDVVQEKTREGAQGESYYLTRIEINMAEFEKIAKKNNLTLQPGMQAEVQIITGTRTLLKYLLDPLTDTMFRAFKEK